MLQKKDDDETKHRKKAKVAGLITAETHELGDVSNWDALKMHRAHVVINLWRYLSLVACTRVQPLE